MGHFHAITHASENQVRQDAFGPDELGSVQSMPLGIHETQGACVGVGCSHLWDTEGLAEMLLGPVRKWCKRDWDHVLGD
jgi:hypothetical protein